MSAFRLGLIAVVGLLLVLVISAPAGLLGLLIPSQMLVAQGLTGSVWNGSAARVLVAAGHGYVHLGEVDWRLSPISLLTLSPALEVESHWGSQVISGRFTVRGARDFDASNVDATVSAQLLREFTPLMLDGTISLQGVDLVMREGLPRSGKGRVVWRDASWLTPQGARALGSYALDFEQSMDKPMLGEVVTIEGPIEASGSIELLEREYALDLLLRGDGGLDPEIRQAIELFAQPEGQGYRVTMNGEI